MNRLPAEWEPQDGVQLTWPHARSDWAPLLPRVVPLYEQLVKALSRCGQVLVAAPTARVQALRRRFGELGVDGTRLHLYGVDADDTWTRDHGPLTVATPEGLCLFDYQLNGWGGKYPAARDNALTAELYRQGAYPGASYRRRDFVLEGGAIESDGAGTLLTTGRCLLNPNRNPGLNRADIEARLGEDLGVTKVNWLAHGALEGDDTDSHIDTLARLCPGNVIAYQACDDADDPHYPELKAMAGELAALTDARGRPYSLVPLPWPSAKYDQAGARMPATYANFLVFNGTVFVPQYDDEHDEEALQQLALAFPGYALVGLNCLPLIHQHGSLHCITMQLPRGVLQQP